MQEKFQLFGRIVPYLLVKVKKSAVGVSFPAPSPCRKSGKIYNSVVVQALVKVYHFRDIKVCHFSQPVTARTFARWVVKGKRVGVSYKGVSHSGK